MWNQNTFKTLCHIFVTVWLNQLCASLADPSVATVI